MNNLEYQADLAVLKFDVNVKAMEYADRMAKFNQQTDY
jgi:hypothetical protein